MAPKWTHRYERETGSGKWVFVPTADAKAQGRLIKKAVEANWKPPAFFFHLRRGGHVKAIRSHQHHKFFLRLDIKDFFGSVNKTRVTRILAARVGYVQARSMAEESTVKHPATGKFILPYGFVQSPILASLALADSRLGKTLARLAKDASLSVSVYMDDIIVSGNDPAKLDECKALIELAASKSLFVLNEEKAQGPAGKITAFNIVLEADAASVAEERMQKFIARYGTAPNAESKAGIRTYVHSVNPEQASQFV